MSYSNILTIRVPASMEAVAQKISQALDPDSGGAKSWGRFNADWIEATTPCHADFYTKAQYLMGNPAMLHREVAADFTKRCAGQEPPTIDEIELFCNSIVRPENNSDSD